MTHRAALTAALLTLLVACRAPIDAVESESVEAQESALIEGSPEAIGVLAFLNASTTTVTVLDIDVPVDARAAQNLIAFRYGPDGQEGTHDDRSFRTIAEVDAVKWVGPATIAKLEAYADGNGWIPKGGDLLGVFDNVAFTVDEANATLALANGASHTELDIDVALDRRAADGILAARPILSMQALSDAYYVGHAAMLALRDYANAAPAGLANDEPCETSSQCASGLCVGETLTGWAECADASMAANFTFDEVTPIPDGDVAGLAMTVNVDGLGSVPVDVVITLDIDHPRKSDLVVVLHQPGGPSDVIWNHEANPPSVVSAGPGIERDYMVNGEWTVEVIDTVSGVTGELRGFNLYLSSRMD